MDNHTPKQRSYNMSQVKSKNTSPEKIVRSILHNMGYRFRLHKKDLPGKPDIVLTKYKTVIEIQGCFWHRHKGCKNATTPRTNVEFWNSKFESNVERDKKNQKKLKELGWNVIILWECEIADLNRLKDILKKHL